MYQTAKLNIATRVDITLILFHISLFFLLKKNFAQLS